MKFHETPLPGAKVIELERREDQRGFFARLFCQQQFLRHGLEQAIAQVNTSFSRQRGTLRGLHYQLPPKAETKLVRCIRGSIYDVILDLRAASPTCGQWFGLELTAENRKMLYVPKGFAHGFLTLADNSEVLYFASEFYSPECERTVRWNDQKFSVHWPFSPKVVSEKDARQPDFDPAHHLPNPHSDWSAVNTPQTPRL
jgi:dTDP-4-dehydrorhamnose 3,5-epimerase